jgi:drug/metabolite transporter (DMT)-like permease
MVEGRWSPVELYFLRSVIYIVLVWSLRAAEIWKFPHRVMPLRKMRMKTFWAFMAAGCVGLALGGIFFGVCVEVLPVSIVTPITASSPFVTVLITRFFYKEKLTRLQNAGVALVILGSVSVSL